MDIVALLEAKGIRVEFKGGDEISIICPNQSQHQDGTDSIASFNINTKKLKSHCLACGFKLGEVGLTKWLLGEDLDEQQMRILKLRSNMKRQHSNPEIFLIEPEIDVMFPAGEPWVEPYRGISAETYQKVGAIKCTRGRYQNRLVVEVRMNGKLVGLDARALGDEQPKYLRPKGLKATDWLFPFDLCLEIIRDRKADYCIIAEGIFHSLNAVDKSFPACCYFGSHNFSQSNVLQLLDLGVSEIIIFPDNDRAGQKATDEIAELLKDLFTVSVADVSNLQVDTEASLAKGKLVYQDLGDISAEEIQWSIDNRKRWNN